MSETKTYRGRGLDELLAQIREELGPDAVIVARREDAEGGVGGFFARRMIELDARPAGARVDVVADEVAEPPLVAQSAAMAGEVTAHDTRGELPSFEEHLQVLLGATSGTAAPPPTQHVAGAEDVPPAIPFERAGAAAEAASASAWVPDLPPPADVEAVEEPEPVAEPEAVVPEPEPVVVSPEPVAAAEVVEAPVEEPVMEEPVYEESAAAVIEEPVAAPPEPEPAPEPVAATPEPVADAPDPVVSIEPEPRPAPAPAPEPVVELTDENALLAVETLTEAGLGAAVARSVVEETVTHLAPFAQDPSLKPLAQRALAARIPVHVTRGAGGLVIGFVGPGGSGKTRCVARLAAAYAARSSLPVAVVTLRPKDGGAELRELLAGTDVEVHDVNDAGAAARRIGELRESAMVVLDTPGVSPRAEDELRLLATELAQLHADELHLTVPATIAPRAARELVTGARILRPSAIAITHQDETDAIGTVVDLAIETCLPLSFVGRGQAVQTGLRRADAGELAHALMP